MAELNPILRVAIPSPVRQTFDYLPPLACGQEVLLPGIRVKVPFGRTTAIGILIEVAAHSRVEQGRLKRALAVLDEQPLIPQDMLLLMLWASSYYHHPLGEVIFSALPPPLREGKPAEVKGISTWQISAAGLEADAKALTRAPRQAMLLSLLRANAQGLSAAALAAGNWRPALAALIAKGWVIERQAPCLGAVAGSADEAIPPLNEAQQQAVQAVLAAPGFQPFVLDGVTGSGKTEVYLRIIEQVIAAGRQALLLVPEIGLTPQLVQRFQSRFQVPLAVLHSNLSDQERLCAWLMARDGSAPIVIGTRSALFTPLHRPGVLIIDEEHDLSFKQQDGFRYHARDLAVIRAQRAQVPIVLGSATPSLETLGNVGEGRYQSLALPKRAGTAQPPLMSVLDVRHQPMEGNISQPFIEMIRQHVTRGEQVLLFLNRRGYAPVLLCHDCGWIATCKRCDARMVLYQAQRSLSRCHHCGAERPTEQRCPSCQSTSLVAIGQGTERVEEVLGKHFAAAGIVRIDRDSTRRKGSMQALLDGVHAGRSQILIGTQMLAKGHHLPNVTFVGIVDADQGLFGVDFRASERMAQLIVQVAGRAGRGAKPGQVVIQTHHPDHPLLYTLITQGYAAFAQAALLERRQAELPPYSHMALLRAEAVSAELPQAFLQQAYEQGRLLNNAHVQLSAPVAAPMERRAGRYRAQLLLQSQQRAPLQRFLSAWIAQIETLKMARKVRWSIDVDPMEMV